MDLNALDQQDELNLLQNPDALVIGVATYSNPDMNFLDSFSDFFRKRKHVFIFDIDDVRSEKDLQRKIPGGFLFTRTPVVGEYKQGLLRTFEQGSAAISHVDALSRSNAL